MHGTDHRLRRTLRKVEVPGQIAEDPDVFSYRWSRVGTTIGSWVQALTAEEVVLDELVVGVEAQRLVIDSPVLGVWTDHERRHAQAVAVLIDNRWRHVVVKATPVVP